MTARQADETICETCGSVQVMVTATRTIELSRRPGRRCYLRRRRYACSKCGARWWRSVRVEEHSLRRS